MIRSRGTILKAIPKLLSVFLVSILAFLQIQESFLVGNDSHGTMDGNSGWRSAGTIYRDLEDAMSQPSILLSKAIEVAIAANNTILSAATSADATSVAKETHMTPQNRNQRSSSLVRYDNLLVDPCLNVDVVSSMWIQGPRAPINQEGMTPQLVQLLLEGTTRYDLVETLLTQTTLCYADGTRKGTFCNLHDVGNDANNDQAMRDWIPRLFFLTLQYRFQLPAMPEYQRRKKQCDANNHNPATSYPPGVYEFQCPDAKFLVMNVSSLGFGAVLNTVVLFGILVSLRTGRIPIFWGEEKPWLFAPRECPHGSKDFQCYFLPLSPCVPTKDEIYNATRYGRDNKPEQRKLRRMMKLPDDMNDDRVVFVDTGMMPPKFQDPEVAVDIAKVVVDTSRELMQAWKSNSVVAGNASSSLQNNPPWSTIEKALVCIQNHPHRKETIHNIGVEAVHVYMLRPNPTYRQILKQETADFRRNLGGNFERAVGLPIRGSDKCHVESSCLSFDTHMDLAKDHYIHYASLPSSPFNPRNATATPKLIITTEDPKVFRKSVAYRSNSNFPYDIVLNENDNLQGTGKPTRGDDFDGNATMVSSLVSLSMQLIPGVIYGNCCSNWHKVMHLFATAGLNAVANPKFVCLNQPPMVFRNPKYRICCQWGASHRGCNKVYKEFQNSKPKNRGRKSSRRQLKTRVMHYK